jgi:hypothetical protein
MTDRLVDVPADRSRIPGDVVLSARVTAQQRAEVYNARRPGETVSDAVRRLLELGLTEQAHRDRGRLSTPPELAPSPDVVAGLLGLDDQPRSHTGDPATSRAAAARAWPRAGILKRRILEELERRGGTGMTSDEAMLEFGYSARQRLSDLKLGGWVTPDGRIEHGELVSRTRKTRLGSDAEVLVLTTAARQRLEAERA